MPTTGDLTPTRTVEGRAVPAPGTYTIDPSHSNVEAMARHLMLSKVRGHFAQFSGRIVVADDIAASSVEVSIAAASIDTRDANRDEHLRSADFLDVDAHPELTFRSTGVEPAGSDRWTLHGDLTIRGVARPVALDLEFLGDATDPWGNARALFSATTEIDREDFRITWNQALETGGVLVSKKLRIELEIQAVRES
ncbi:MAG: YceI family protein [Euzebyales bacterium]|nr:YceI family protein [Euzebyales bacterium]